MKRYLPVLLGAGLLLAFSSLSLAANPNYDFKIVASVGQTIDGLQLVSFGSPSCLNDEGLIVFTGAYQTSPGNDLTALFTPYRVIIKTGDVVGGKAVAGPYGCATNNSGAILFTAGLPSGGQGLFEGSESGPGRLVAWTGEKLGSLTVKTLLNFEINDAGKIVFSALYGINGNESGLFTPQAPLVVNGDKIGGYPVYGINPMFALNSENVFLHASSGSIGEGIFDLQRLLAKQGDTISGYQLIPTGSSTFGYLAASSGDKFVFGATFNGGAGIFEPSKILAYFGGDLLPPTAAVNNAGTIVYGGSSGLMINQVPLFNFFDMVDGYIVNGLSFPVALNNKGDVLFMADFEGGNEGLVLATRKRN